MMADVGYRLHNAHRAGAQPAVRGRAGHAARHRPRHLSVRHLEQLRGRQRGGRRRRRAGACCTTSWASPRPTPRASAAARSRPSCRSDEPGTRRATTCPPSGRSAARSPVARAAAAGSTPRRSSARSSSTASPACASPSSTCSTACRRSRSASATSSAASTLDILPLDADDIARLRADLRDAARLEREHRRADAVGRSCRSTRGATCERVQALIGVPIDMVSTGPDREHTIVLRHPYRA